MDTVMYSKAVICILSFAAGFLLPIIMVQIKNPH